MRENMVKIEKPNNLGGYPVSVHNHIRMRYAAMNDSIITKICPKCQIEKPISEFNKSNGHKDGLGSYCKDCIKLYQQENKLHIAEYQKQYRIKNGESLRQYAREHHAMYRYGISKKQLDKLVDICGSSCQICGASLSVSNPPHVDHNHDTGEVRGILCRCCNSGLGLFQDSTMFLKKAIEYLS